MSKYSLDKILEMITFEPGDKGYIEISDLALFLLKRPDSLLSQAITRSKRNPNHIKEIMLGFQPRSGLLTSQKTQFTEYAKQKIHEWQEEGSRTEEEITRLLIELPGTLSYAIVILKIQVSAIIENIKISVYEGPVRINTPALNKGINMTALARRGKYVPCIGRENEIRKLSSILLRMTKNFPILIGEPGVGKTAVVEGFAQYLISSEAPAKLKNCTIIDFPVSLFTAGHKYVGEVEQFAQKLIDELKRNEDVILFLDEIHTLIGAGSHDKSEADVAQIFKPVLARGEIKVIGATTLAEYKILEKDAAFERRINPILIEEPSISEAVKMLVGACSRYQKYHDLVVQEGVLEDVVKLSNNYLTHRKLPDKAFDLLDYSMARVRTYSQQAVLSRQDVLCSLAEITGVEIIKNEDNMSDRVQEMESKLKSDVIGQDHAINKVMNKIKLAYGGLVRRDKPLGVFMFLGHSGTGKTHLAKNIAKYLFGDERRFLRLDMGEFTESNSVNRLIGSPPGYQGNQEGGILTEFIKNNPFSIVLFDEIEKAHYQVSDIFLSLFGEGRISDGRGRTMDARNIICIMTSNHDIELIKPHFFLGEMDPEEQARRLKANLAKAFRPELLNRIDDVVVFKKLDEEDMIKICRLGIERIIRRLRDMDIIIDIADDVVEFLSKTAFGSAGARQIDKIVEESLLLPLSEMRLEGKIGSGHKCRILTGKDELEFEVSII